MHGPQLVVVTAAELEVRDNLGSVRAASMEATLRRQGDCQVSLREAAVEPASGAAASADEVTLRWRSPERFLPVGLPVIELRGGAVTPWKRLAMTGIRGTIKPDPSAGTRAVIELFGGYGGVDKELWQARGWVQPPTEGPWSRAEAELSLRAERFRLSQLEPILKNTPIIDADKTEVDASLELKFGQGALSFGGSFQMAGLSVFSPRLVAEPVRNLGFNITANGRLELKTRKLRLDRAAIRWNGAEVDIDADAEAQPRSLAAPSPTGTRPAGGSAGGRWPCTSWCRRSTARRCSRRCRSRSCRASASSSWRGRSRPMCGYSSTSPSCCACRRRATSTTMRAGADTLAPGAPETTPPPPPLAPLPARRSRRGRALAAAAPAKDPKDDPVQVSGQVGIGGCRVLKAPAGHGGGALPVELHPHGPGRAGPRAELRHRPPEPRLRALRGALAVPYQLDHDHRGQRLSAPPGLYHPRSSAAPCSPTSSAATFASGASSITMQMVKNVLLSREKTLSRKLQEMFLTWYLETNLADDQDLIKALNKGFSVTQYRQQQAKLKKPVPAPEPAVPTAAPPPSPPAQAVPAALPARRARHRERRRNRGRCRRPRRGQAVRGAPVGQSNLYAVAQARQALREISPIKKRILEIYFNAIEFGPYIYGIGRATRHYFGKPPKDLTPREAAFFSSILPSPKRRYIQYCKGAADEDWEKYVDRIVRRVH